MDKLFSGMMLALLLACILPVAFKLQQVNGVIITVPDDYQTIQAAVNTASENDTILVRNGTYNESIVVNKTLSLVGENMATTILNGTMIVEANNVNVSGFAFRGMLPNIFVNTTTGVNLVRNSIIFNAIGIEVENSSSVTMESNVINGSGLDNIGILLDYSSGCRIINNTITSAVYWGIRFWFSDNNTVNFNLIEGNDEGIDFLGSSQNIVSENTISKSQGAGIYFDSGSGNKFFENNFINNWTPIQFWTSTVNVWDNGSRGNYWSDYRAKYPNASEIDSSGIWNTSYVIDANNADHYPLVNQPIIPEFTSLLMLPLMMVATLLAVIVYRKKTKRESSPRLGKEAQPNVPLDRKVVG